MTSYLLRGILIGLLFGLPVGAIGTMTVQRTWSFGLRAGLLTGLGSSVADSLYASVGAFGLTLISDFLMRHQRIIHFLGCGLILLMGIRLFLKRGKAAVLEIKAAGGVRLFLSSFAIGAANPAALLTFLFAYSYFGVTGGTGTHDRIRLVCGVFIGTYIWWGLLSAITRAVRRKTTGPDPRCLNRIFGTILFLFALSLFLKALL